MASGLRWPDRIVVVAVIVLMAVSPLAFGGVHRSVFTHLEVIAFVAFIAWTIKAWQERPTFIRSRITYAEFARLALPAAAFVGFFILQLIPLPARILRIIAPATYQLYCSSFPGWPAFSPYQTLAPIWAIPSAASPPVSPSAVHDIQPSASVTGFPRHELRAPPIPSRADRLNWATLSLAPQPQP